MSERHIEMSDLVDRLVELASWCEQHSYECPVTARDDLMAAAFRLAATCEERDEARTVARHLYANQCVYRRIQVQERYPWLVEEMTVEDAE